MPEGPLWLNAVHATVPEKVVGFVVSPAVALPSAARRPFSPDLPTHLARRRAPARQKCGFAKNALREEADYLADCTVREVMVLPLDLHAYWSVRLNGKQRGGQ